MQWMERGEVNGGWGEELFRPDSDKDGPEQSFPTIWLQLGVLSPSQTPKLLCARENSHPPLWMSVYSLTIRWGWNFWAGWRGYGYRLTEMYVLNRTPSILVSRTTLPSTPRALRGPPKVLHPSHPSRSTGYLSVTFSITATWTRIFFPSRLLGLSSLLPYGLPTGRHSIHLHICLSKFQRPAHSDPDPACSTVTSISTTPHLNASLRCSTEERPLWVAFKKGKPGQSLATL